MDARARLLRLLSLPQARRDWAGADLAERLGVTPRTLRRDVARPRGCAAGWRRCSRRPYRSPDSGATVDPKLLTAITAACRGAHRLRFDYVDGRGAPTDRDVEPQRLVHAGRRW